MCVLYVVSLVTFTVLGWTIRGSLNLLKDKYVQNVVVGAFLDESRQLLQVVTSLVY